MNNRTINATAYSIKDFVAQQNAVKLTIEGFERLTSHTYSAWGIDANGEQVRYWVAVTID